MRLREHSESTPKPMVHIGNRPILWHLMKYYAHFGHREFILCLGWQGELIKRYFLDYDQHMSNDFVLSSGGQRTNLLDGDIADWTITFVDTGTAANIGQRLLAIRDFLDGDEVFLANYADGLTDFHLPDLILQREQRGALATFLSVRPTQSFHEVKSDEQGVVVRLRPINQTDVWMNGGFFVMTSDVLDYLHPGEDLVAQPFNRLIDEGRLATVRWGGFWSCMDTYKEKQALDEMFERGETPWIVWK